MVVWCWVQVPARAGVYAVMAGPCGSERGVTGWMPDTTPGIYELPPRSTLTRGRPATRANENSSDCQIFGSVCRVDEHLTPAGWRRRGRRSDRTRQQVGGRGRGDVQRARVRYGVAAGVGAVGGVEGGGAGQEGDELDHDDPQPRYVGGGLSTHVVRASSIVNAPGVCSSLVTVARSMLRAMIARAPPRFRTATRIRTLRRSNRTGAARAMVTHPVSHHQIRRARSFRHQSGGGGQGDLRDGA